MSDVSDRVAITALVVSLIALVVTLLQLLQAIAGTAEGYRRCADSVIGPWARLRKRNPKWSELRTEVIFVTPHFTVLPADISFIEHGDVSKDSFYLGVRVIAQTERDTFHQVMKESLEPVEIADAPSTTSPAGTNTTEIGLDAEKGVQRAATYSRRQEALFQTHSLRGKKGSPQRANEITASWLWFIEDLHRTHRNYWLDRDEKINKANFAVGHTAAVISPREWNWDFMPSDLLRPLSTSTLGDIVLLGLRLGMDWRKLDLTSGFLADGNGRTLSSLDVRGLGLVFKFSREEKVGIHTRMVGPSKAADQLMFGIIPGDHDLIGKDRSFPMVAADRKIHGWPPREVLQALGVEEKDVIDRVAGKVWQEPCNELVHLISPFLPLKDCPYPWVLYPAWVKADSVYTPFHWFEGRVGFMDELQQAVDAGTHKELATLKSVLRKFKMFRSDWKADFLDHWKETSLQDKSVKDRLELIDACRGVFERTTDFFCGNKIKPITPDSKPTLDVTTEPIPGTFDWSEQGSDGSRYLHLVAAHYITGCRAAKHASQNLNELRKDYPEELRGKHRELMRGHYDTRLPGDHIQYRLAQQYVRCFENEDHGMKHLRDKDVQCDRHVAEAARWVLILRGVAWDMASAGDVGYSRGSQGNPRGPLGKWRGDPIPSAFYDMKTPVWIT